MLSDALDVAIGSLELMLGGVVLAHLWRFGRGFPWLVALTCFFALRGIDRIVVGAFGAARDLLGLLIDPLIVTVLVLLLVSIERVVRELEAAEDSAKLREREYERALLDYRRLARHRLATPLTAVIGSVRMLLELGPDESELRAELVEILEGAVVRLERVSLDPRGELAPDERSLRPSPSFDTKPP